MIARLKNQLIPTILIILLLTAYFTRWEHETSFKPSESIQVKYKRDRWTGERWMTIYSPTRGTVIKPDAPTSRAGDIIWWNKTLGYMWGGLFSLSIIWLFGTFIFKNKNKTKLSSLKKKIKEEEAAALFYLTMRKNIEDDWIKIIEQLKSVNHGIEIKFINEDYAKIELLLACFALDLMALEKLFYPDKARRLFDWSVKHFCSDAHEEIIDYIKISIANYIGIFQNAENKGENPLTDIGNTIYIKWGLKNITIKAGNMTIEAPEPILSMAISTIVVSYLGKWKCIKENFEIIV